jgi:type I restriction enzyme M protein
MSTDTHRQIANDIWSICNLLRGPYKRNEYRKGKPESIIRSVMQGATGYPFYNLSKLEFRTSQKDVNSLLDDPSHLAPNLNSYINGFSPNVRAIMERFAFDQQIARMAEKNLLFKVVQKFATFDLSFSHLAPDQAAMQMGYVFEELIRIGAEQSNEEAGEHFTPREVIKLMVNLLLSPEQDLRRSHVVKTIYDPACGTGGMLSVAEKYIRDLNSDAKPLLYGQDWNDEAWAVCRSDMLIKGEDVVNAIGERDESAEICFNRDGEAEPDAELRDTENVPLKESIQAYFEREVLPHVPDAWIDHSKTKLGYEIPLNRHFYRYEPPRELAVIEGEIKALEAAIVRLLGEVTA